MCFPVALNLSDAVGLLITLGVLGSRRLFSPSKVNLTLKVEGHTQGYHKLRSLFRSITLGDQMMLNIYQDGHPNELVCSTEGVPLDERNTIIKALTEYQQATQHPFRFRVELLKEVPHEAGLGGGSGNAATALFGANQLVQDVGHPGLFPERLAELGLKVGADVPFFLASSGFALCTGRGEEITDIRASDQTEVVIVKPQLGLSTKKVFDKFREKYPFSPADTERLYQNFNIQGLHSLELPQEQSAYENDLEGPAFDLLPELKALKVQLQSIFKVASMSGSGTAFFGIFPRQTPEVCQENLESLEAQGHLVRHARFCQREPTSWFDFPE